ncbi:pyridoxal-phosphate-dependent aminotransferase family protein [Bacillus horti]|uniref:Aspartate aminotransferase-like enzyme n=1 Tax=Caldalkalibacillus horti TaxID=77523 RepID=A0ABT9W4K0_9BACI|nr:alanine--glyoxylate aminotransferase family protein [Bacillus horti]MDQ0168178.1 aspartate aminotransferase-like enzyme [Bacillus horti]
MLPDHQTLRIPGPTPIPPSVQKAMAQGMIGHRSSDFKQLLQEISPRLKPIFGTTHEVLLLTNSGTAGLEAAVVNSLQPHDEVLVLVTGAFGERFVKICETYQAHVHRLDVQLGRSVQPEQVSEFLKQYPKVKAVFVTYCETSTAVLNPVAEIATAIHDVSDALVIVDGVSCVGAVPMQMDEWGIDIVVTGSQKAFMLPTGLSFIAISEKAQKIIDQNKQPRFYLDLRKYRDSIKEFSTPFTPAVSLIQGLQQTLNLFEEEGLEQVFKRHVLMRDMTRAACRALNLPLLTSDEDASPTVTAIRPIDFQADELRGILKKEFGITIAGGQQQLQGKIFRLGHMGYCAPSDVLQYISAVEIALKRLKVEIELGQGLKAAQEVYYHAI